QDTLVHQLTDGQKNKISIASLQTPIDCRDDFIISTHQNSIHNLIENDFSKDNIFLSKIDQKEILPNTIISPTAYPFLNLRINEDLQNIVISTDYPIDTIVQFSYESCTSNNQCGQAKATLKINHSGANQDNNINRQEWINLYNQASAGDTIDLNGRTIIVSGNPLYIGKGVCLRNGTIKRAATPASSLAYPTPSSTNTIVVNEPELFCERDRILIVNGPDFQDNSGGQLLSIREIRGDTIESFNDFVFPMDSGSTVIHQFPLLQIALPPGEHLYLSGLLFDGNKNKNSFTFDWRYNHTFSMNHQTTVDNCTFKNNPTENIFICGGQVSNSRSYNLNGSFIHGSCQATNTETTLINNNFSYGTCLIPESSNGHNEGWFTYSANVRLFNVVNNRAIYGGEACFGNQGLDDYDNIFTGNYFDTFLSRKAYTHPNHTNEDDLSENIFINIQDE
ncbi:MAG: hypothetical protein AAGH79_17455, partial [Bacteroidota bacterium]